jgi:hypothetical protein
MTANPPKHLFSRVKSPSSTTASSNSPKKAILAQFTNSLASIQKYLYIEYKNVDDLKPLFQSPSKDVAHV